MTLKIIFSKPLRVNYEMMNNDIENNIVQAFKSLL